MTKQDHPGDRLRRQMRAGMGAGVVAAPGTFNALTARLVVEAGFEACYVSGAATSVAAGVPDVGILTLDHFTQVVREVARAARDERGAVPVIADADTGFGEAEMVRRTVIEYERAGAAGLHIEDQVFPKRCGHLDGKVLVPMDHAVEKIQWAAKASADCSGSKFIICARTDARGVEGMDAAIERARAYVEAGADMIFPEGLASEDEFETFARAMKKTPSARCAGTSPVGDGGGEKKEGWSGDGGPYLLANMTEFGKTPIIDLSRFGAMGYDLVIYPVSMLRVAMGAVGRALAALKRDGSVASFLDEMQTREELYRAIEYTPGEGWEMPARS
jgi:methylisocitrate lyase